MRKFKDHHFNTEKWNEFTPVLRDCLERGMSLALDFWKPIGLPTPTGKPVLSIASTTTLEPPVGSAAQFSFEVQDDATSPTNPLASFKVFDGITDISSEGTFSPLPGQVDSSGTWIIAWNTNTRTLADEGKQFRFEVTDGDGLKNELGVNDETTIIINFNDPLKVLAGHPVAKSSTYSWVA